MTTPDHGTERRLLNHSSFHDKIVIAQSSNTGQGKGHTNSKVAEEKNQPKQAKRGYERLQTTQYLNDTIVNDGLGKIMRGEHTVSYINSYFITNLRKYGGTDRSTKQGLARIQQTDIDIWKIPVCHVEHWYFLRIQKSTKTIPQTDQLNRRTEHFGEHI